MKSCALLLALAPFVGCSKTNGASSYGEPIGIRVASSTDGGAELDVAVAATKGKDLAPAVNKLAVAFHGAMISCPTLAKLSGDRVLHVKMSLERGRLKSPATAPADPMESCVTAALDGKEILPEGESMDLIAELRAGRAAGT